MERKLARIIFGAVVVPLMALLVLAALVLPGRSKPLPNAELADGRILQVEGVTFGTYHEMGFKSPVENVGPWLPRKLYALLTPKVPHSDVHLDHPGLVVWVNAINPATGKHVDCQGIRVEIVGENGDVFAEDTSSWFGSPSFWRVGHVFYAFPRSQRKLAVQVTPWRTNASVRFDVPNPDVARPADWSGQSLPQHQLLGDLDVALTGLLLRTNGSAKNYWESPSLYWSPVWELRQAGKPASGWEEPDWIAEDPTGNRSKFLGVHQRVERFSGTFYPSPTNAQAAVLIGRSPWFSVHDLQSNTWWSLNLNYENHPISILGVFTNGTHVFLDGIYQTNPAVSMGPVHGGAPSGWVGQSQRVTPTRVNQWAGHYTPVPVIYIQTKALRSTGRLAVRLRDNEGHYWVAKPEPQGNTQGISPFLLELPEEVKAVVAEFVVLKPVEAQFLVQMPEPLRSSKPVQAASDGPPNEISGVRHEVTLSRLTDLQSTGLSTPGIAESAVGEPSILVEGPSRANPVTAAMAVNRSDVYPGDKSQLQGIAVEHSRIASAPANTSTNMSSQCREARL